jgi:hypothetical protein
MTLATFHPFRQTEFFQQYAPTLAWPTAMITLMVMLGLLMMSHVPYPVVPKFGFQTVRGVLTGIWMLAMIVLAIWIPALFFFPALLGYVAYGVFKATILGFFERLPERDPLLDEEAGDEAGAEIREIDYGELSPARPPFGFGRLGRRGRRSTDAASSEDVERHRRVEGSQ